MRTAAIWKVWTHIKKLCGKSVSRSIFQRKCQKTRACGCLGQILENFVKNRTWGSFIDAKAIFFENQLHFGKFRGLSENPIENRSSSHFFRNCGEIVGQLSGLSGNCRATVGAVVQLSRASCMLASPHPATLAGTLHSKTHFWQFFWQFDWNGD